MAMEREYLFNGGVAGGQRIATPVGMTKHRVPDTRVPAGGCVRAAPLTGREVIIYTRRTINTPVGRVHYFAPEDWADLQALEQLFGEMEE
jgi:hypothetical protein